MACKMAHGMVGKMAHRMAGGMAHKMAFQWVCKRAFQWACKKACQWACKRAFQWACKMVWVGHKMVWMACILKNNPVLAHMMLDNRMGLVVADILHSGNLVLERMVDSIQGAAAGSYIAGVGDTQGAVGNTQGAEGNGYIPGVGDTQRAVGNNYIAGVGNSYIAGSGNTQAGNLMVAHMGNAAQRLKQHTN